MVIKIIFLLIGAFIGAGFISGKEIYIFFYVYGEIGILGIVISSFIISYIVYKTLNVLESSKIVTYKEFIELIFKKNRIENKIKNTFYLLINFFLLISFYIMIAGIAEYFFQEFFINKFISASITCILSWHLLNNDVKKIMEINKYLIPFLILMIGILSIINIKDIFIAGINRTSISKNNFTVFSLIFSAILYASYNCIILIPICINIKRYLLSKKENKIIGIFIFFILLILSMLIFLLLSIIKIDIKNIELPLVYIANYNGIIYKYLFGIAIFFAIFTTAISSGYGFINNLKNKRKSLNIICITAIFISTLGFGNLISFLYPIFGVLGIWQILIIIRYKA